MQKSPSLIGQAVGSIFLGLTFSLLATPGYAQTATEAERLEEIARLNAQSALATAQAGAATAETTRINAEAGRDKARIQSLGLPSFEGTTTLSGTNAGAMEATMLAMHALQSAADQISESVCLIGVTPRQLSDLSDENKKKPKCAVFPNTQPYLVLAGAEAVDFSPVSVIDAQIWGLRAEFLAAGIDLQTQDHRLRLFSGVTTGIAALSAIAGMLRSETTVSAVELSAVGDRALAGAVAGRLGNTYLPSAAIGPVKTTSRLFIDLAELVRLRQQAASKLATETDTARKAALTAVIARFDAFSAKVTTPDDKGVVPIVRAARLDELDALRPNILRVYVDKAGGTFVNTKNINTFFGADPLRVTGAVVASYTVTKPELGSVTSSNIYVCRTALTRLRPVHDASWKGEGGQATAACTATRQ